MLSGAAAFHFHQQWIRAVIVVLVSSLGLHLVLQQQWKINDNNSGTTTGTVTAFYIRDVNARRTGGHRPSYPEMGRFLYCPDPTVQSTIIRQQQYHSPSSSSHRQWMSRTRNKRLASFLLSSWMYEFGGVSVPGTDPDRPQKVNQDGYIAFCGPNTKNKTNVFHVVGVMDGHGLKGHELVHYIQNQLPQRISESLQQQQQTSHLSTSGSDRTAPSATATTTTSTPRSNDTTTTTTSTAAIHGTTTTQHDDALEQYKRQIIEIGHADPLEMYLTTTVEDDRSIQQALVDSFLQTQLDARSDTSVPSGRSGTTCCVCVVRDTTRRMAFNRQDGSRKPSLLLYTATVGDSQAILITCHRCRPTLIQDDSTTATTTSTTSWTVQRLTTPTTLAAMPEAERQRMKQGEGRIDSSNNIFYGPIGIEMTRSLGNAVMLRAGVLPVPIVTTYSLEDTASNTTLLQEDVATGETTYYICVGTDGVFDVLSNERIVEIVQLHDEYDDMATSNINLTAVTQEVCLQARKAWLADLPIETKVDDATFVMLQCTPINTQ